MLSKRRFQKESIRKLFHLMGVPIVLVYTICREIFSERIGILVLTGLLLILLEVEYIRLEYQLKLPEALNVLRKSELKNITSAIFFIAATIIVFAGFDYQIALVALLLGVFGDFASALVGIKFGKHKVHKNKTLEGFLAGFIVNLLIGYLFLPAYVLVFIAMAMVASVVELFTGKLDDNLTVPLFSAAVGQIIIYFLQIDLNSFPGPIMGVVLEFILKLFNIYA